MVSQLISFALLAVNLVAAAPMMHVEKTDAWQYGTGGGIIGFIVLILDIIAIGMDDGVLMCL